MFASTPGGFEEFWTKFVNYVYPGTQIVYWIVMIVAVLYAVMLLKRWVDFTTGVAKDKAEKATEDEEKSDGEEADDAWSDEDDAEDSEGDEKISVEEFVE